MKGKRKKPLSASEMADRWIAGVRFGAEKYKRKMAAYHARMRKRKGK